MSSRHILDELASIKAPDHIKKRANQIYRDELKAPRFKKRKKLLSTWYCLYQAFEEIGEFKEPGELAEEFIEELNKFRIEESQKKKRKEIIAKDDKIKSNTGDDTGKNNIKGDNVGDFVGDTEDRNSYESSEDSSFRQRKKIINPQETFSHKDMRKAHSFLSQAKTGFHPSNNDRGVLDILPSFCDRLDFDIEDTKSLMRFAKNIFRRIPDLTEPSPYKIASGILLYWCERNKVSVSEENLSNLSCLSFSTIDETRRILKKALEM